VAPTSFIQSISSFESAGSISADPGTVLVLYRNGQFIELVPEGQKAKSPLFAGVLPNRIRKVYTVYTIRRGSIEVPLTIEGLDYNGIVDSDRSERDMVVPISSVRVTASASLANDGDLEDLLRHRPDDIDSELQRAVRSITERIIRGVTRKLTLMQIRDGGVADAISDHIRQQKLDGQPVNLNAISIDGWSWPEILDIRIQGILSEERVRRDAYVNSLEAQAQAILAEERAKHDIRIKSLEAGARREEELLDVEAAARVAAMLGVPSIAVSHPELYQAAEDRKLEWAKEENHTKIQMIEAIARMIEGPGGSAKTAFAGEALGAMVSSIRTDHASLITPDERPSTRTQPRPLLGQVVEESPTSRHLLLEPRILETASDLGIQERRITGCVLVTSSDRQRGEALIITDLSDAEVASLHRPLLSNFGLRELVITHVDEPDPKQIVRSLLSREGSDRVALGDLAGIDVRITRSAVLVAIHATGDFSRASNAVEALNSPDSLQAEALSRIFGRQVEFSLTGE